MSEGNFHLSKVEMQAMANELAKQQEECKMLIEKIYSNVDALKGSWKDNSQAEYVANIEGFKASFNRLIKAIGDYSSCLGRAVNLHSATEAENASKARGISTDDIIL